MAKGGGPQLDPSDFFNCGDEAGSLRRLIKFKGIYLDQLGEKKEDKLSISGNYESYHY